MFYKLSELSEHFQLFNVFKYITFRTFAALLTSLFIYFIFGKRFIEFLQRLQVGQVIRQEGPQSHLSKKGTPTMGGILIVGAAFVSTLLWGNGSNAFTWLSLGILVSFGLIGFVDDYRKMVKKQNLGLQGRHKLILQFLFALSAGYCLLGPLGFDRELYVPFVKFNIHPNLGWFYLLLIALVVVGASNAVNLTDGLDGLAAAPNIIAFATYAIFAYIAGNVKIAAYLQVPVVPGAGEVAVFCGAVMGALLGFLWYNAYPAEVFMGDVGSLSLGASLGWVAVVTKNEILLIVVGGIFVLKPFP
jgi:phospho-N-acetylmuramoyl-pentapeptide-transferase